MPVSVASDHRSLRRWLLALPVAGVALAAAACTVNSTGDGTGGSPNPPAGGSGGTATVVPTGGTGVTTGGTGVTTGGTGVTTGGTGVATGGTGITTAGSSTGGSAPTAGSGTGGTGGGNLDGMDTPPVRPLMIDKGSASNNTITFSAKQLDPMAGSSTPDTNAGAQEHGHVDTSRPVIQGKLVLTLGGIGTCCGQGGIGGFAVGLGFHEMGIAMLTTNDAMPQKYKDAAKNNDPEANRQMGDSRMEAFDGKDRVDWLNINEHDALAMRTALALKYMQMQDPGGDWAYFLNADGTVRWSDVYLVGYSYGSQTLAVVAKYVRIGRGIATSGPVDEGFPMATWITQKSATPLDRMYGLFGSTNLDTKVQTSTAAGWIGPPVTVNGGAASADLMMGHLFILTGQGHSEFCAGDGGTWKALCQYSFGVMQ